MDISKVLTITQLINLDVGDWVWIVYKDTGYGSYYKKFQIAYDSINCITVDTRMVIKFYYSNYGTKWLAYKNKEQAEGKC